VKSQSPRPDEPPVPARKGATRASRSVGLLLPALLVAVAPVALAGAFWAGRAVPPPAPRESSEAAELAVSALFGDHMVLQRDMPMSVFGTAAPGRAVRVRLHEHGVTRSAAEARAGVDGAWTARLPPLPAGGPYTLEIEAGHTMTFADVLVGEVWIASGQSNMSRTVDMETPSEVVAADRAAREIPHLPLLTVSRFPTDARPSGIGGRWEIARADTAGRFSAVGFHFGRAVHRAEHVPVGVIQASVSGAPLAAWLGPDALAALARIEDQPISSIERCWALTLDAGDHRARAAVYEPIYDRWRREVALPALARREPFEPPPDAPLGSRFHPWAPSTLFHGMIAPLAPFTLRGVIWWQGEGNATRPNEYAAAFPRMIESWRALWGQGSFPFLFVQLGGTREDRASLREVQRQTLDRVLPVCNPKGPARCRVMGPGGGHRDRS
jgi:sialate O-acetylesterase